MIRPVRRRRMNNLTTRLAALFVRACINGLPRCAIPLRLANRPMGFSLSFVPAPYKLVKRNPPGGKHVLGASSTAASSVGVDWSSLSVTLCMAYPSEAQIPTAQFARGKQNYKQCWCLQAGVHQSGRILQLGRVFDCLGEWPMASCQRLASYHSFYCKMKNHALLAILTGRRQPITDLLRICI